MVDLIYTLKERDRLSNYLRLDASLRIRPNARISKLVYLFSQSKAVSDEEFIYSTDETLLVHSFKNQREIISLLKKIVESSLLAKSQDLYSLLTSLVLKVSNFEEGLTAFQILTPRKSGDSNRRTSMRLYKKTTKTTNLELKLDQCEK